MVRDINEQINQALEKISKLNYIEKKFIDIDMLNRLLLLNELLINQIHSLTSEQISYENKNLLLVKANQMAEKINTLK